MRAAPAGPLPMAAAQTASLQLEVKEAKAVMAARSQSEAAVLTS